MFSDGRLKTHAYSPPWDEQMGYSGQEDKEGFNFSSADSNFLMLIETPPGSRHLIVQQS